MNLRRVAIIFDDKTRPETTGVYCRRALGQMVEFEHLMTGTTTSIVPRSWT